MALRETAQSGFWTDPNTWVGGVVPQAGDQVKINQGHTVTYDVVEGSSYDVILGTSATANDILVYGTLRFHTGSTQNLRLRVRGQCAIYGTGKVEIGSPTDPIPANIRVTWEKTDAGEASVFVARENNARLSIHGSPILPSDGAGGYKIWTFTTQPASSGATQITVQDNLNWAVGDEIIMPKVGLSETYGDAPLVTSISPFVTSVTGVTINQDGTVTLSLADGLPHAYISGVIVGKLNRNVIIAHAGTSRSYMVDDSYFTLITDVPLAWFYYKLGGTSPVSGVIRRASPSSGSALVFNYISVRSPSSAYPSPLYEGNVPLRVNKSVIGLYIHAYASDTIIDNSIVTGHTSLACTRNLLVQNSHLVSVTWTGNLSGNVEVRNSTVWTGRNPSSVSVCYENCTFVGKVLYQNFGAIAAGVEIYKDCTFKVAVNGTFRPRFDWVDLASSSYRAIYINPVIDASQWVEPSSFGRCNDSVVTAHSLEVQFINKKGSSGQVLAQKQIYRRGGVISLDTVEKPSGFAYSWKFEPKSGDANLIYPLIMDIGTSAPLDANNNPLPFEFRIWVKKSSAANPAWGRAQLINAEDADRPPGLVTPIAETDISGAGTMWTLYVITAPAGFNGYLRIMWKDTTGIAWVATEIVART